jgi:hypothetical protein
MRNKNLATDSLREGLKDKGRSRRQSAAKRANAAGCNAQLRNDLLPKLQIDVYPIDGLRSNSRRLRNAGIAARRDDNERIAPVGIVTLTQQSSLFGRYVSGVQTLILLKAFDDRRALPPLQFRQ